MADFGSSLKIFKMGDNAADCFRRISGWLARKTLSASLFSLPLLCFQRFSFGEILKKEKKTSFFYQHFVLNLAGGITRIELGEEFGSVERFYPSFQTLTRIFKDIPSGDCSRSSRGLWCRRSSKAAT